MSEIFLGRSVKRNSPADYARSGPGGEIAGTIAEELTPGGSNVFKNLGGFFRGGEKPHKPAIKEAEFVKSVKAKLDAEGKKK